MVSSALIAAGAALIALGVMGIAHRIVRAFRRDGPTSATSRDVRR